MSCQKILEVITEEGITSAEISEKTELPRKYVAACLVRFVKRGVIVSKKIEASNKLGPRMISVFSLAKEDPI